MSDKQKQKVPALRFPEFQDEWKVNLLGDCLGNITGGGTPSREKTEYYENGTIPWVTVKDLSEDSYKKDTKEYITDLGLKNSAAKLIKKGSFIISTRMGLGRGFINIVPMALNQDMKALEPNNNIEINFLMHWFKTNSLKIERLGVGSTVKGIDLGTLKKIKFIYPDKPEQQKIASFLSAVDEKIRQLTEKKALLEDYKKGVMQQIFSQKIRFRDNNGNSFPDWEEKKLSAFLYETKLRNYDLKYDKNDVLSVSGECGIVNQIEFMGRSYAGKSVANYHIVRKADIVYTKSPLKSNPFGIIKTNLGKAGIVSTLYAVYGVKDSACGHYLDYYFQLNDNTNKYLRPLVHKGAKNDMKINNAQVLTGKVSIPSLSEQQKIASFLTALDKKIEVVQNRLTLAQEFKKGLLQQMFV